MRGNSSVSGPRTTLGDVSKSQPPTDNPIDSSEEDQLGRSPVAHDFARQVCTVDASHGLVVAVMGPWGNGKTSFVNLMREQFEEDQSLTVIDFNPWMFSGAQQLTDIFFKEVAAEIRMKGDSTLKSVADGLDQYGDVLGSIASVFGPIGTVTLGLGRLFAKSSAKVAELRRGGTRQLHQKVADELRKLEQPVIVIVDDIDRLTTDEIRDIFKLVRLTASFPNLIYILAFDRQRVERALDEANVPGRAYLEKIVQLSFDLPAINSGTLQVQIFAELDRVLGDLPEERFDASRWPDVFTEVIEPMFTNLRDVTRFAVSARPTLLALGHDLDFVDLAALEAIRVFRPELFAQIHGLATELTTVNGFSSREPTREQAAIRSFISSAGDEGEVVKSLIQQVFPAARHYIENQSFGSSSSNAWQAAHRVAHINWLSFYLNRVIPSGLHGFKRAELLLGLMADSETFQAGLDCIPPEDLEDMLDALAGLADKFSVEAIVPASFVLENLIPKVPDRPRRGMFDFNRPNILVARVVLQLQMKLEHESEREIAVSEILPRIKTFSSKYEFIRMVGHVEGQGHKLVSKDFATKIEAEFHTEVQGAAPYNGSQEWDAVRVYHLVSEQTGRPTLPNIEDPDLIRSLFKSAKSTSASQSMGSRSVATEDALWWDGLVKVVGSEDALQGAAKILRAVDGETPLLELVDKYLAGWRPRSWGA